MGAVLCLLWVYAERCQVDLWKLMEPRLLVYTWVLFVYLHCRKSCVDVKDLCVDLVWAHYEMWLLRYMYPPA